MRNISSLMPDHLDGKTQNKYLDARTVWIEKHKIYVPKAEKVAMGILQYKNINEKFPDTLTKGRYRDIVEYEVRTYWKYFGIKTSQTSTALQRAGINATLYAKRN